MSILLINIIFIDQNPAACYTRYSICSNKEELEKTNWRLKHNGKFDHKGSVCFC